MVDWWSFGVLVYEMLFGATPFLGDRRDDTFHNILYRQPRFPHSPAVSPAVRDLLTKLLHKVGTGAHAACELAISTLRWFVEPLTVRPALGLLPRQLQLAVVQ